MGKNISEIKHILTLLFCDNLAYKTKWHSSPFDVKSYQSNVNICFISLTFFSVKSYLFSYVFYKNPTKHVDLV